MAGPETGLRLPGSSSCSGVFGISHTSTPPFPASSQRLLTRPHSLHFPRTLFWIRILNQINSGIGIKAVCRGPSHTSSSASFWPAAGIQGPEKHGRASSVPWPPRAPPLSSQSSHLPPPHLPLRAQDHHHHWRTPIPERWLWNQLPSCRMREEGVKELQN